MLLGYHVEIADAVEAGGLVKVYGKNFVLRSLSFWVSEGDSAGILGTSGCGKTTLLNILGGLDLATSGEVYIDGRRFDGVTEN